MPTHNPKPKEQEEVSNQTFWLLCKKIFDDNNWFRTLQEELFKEKLMNFLLGEKAEKKAKEEALLSMVTRITPVANKADNTWLDKLAETLRKFTTEFSTTVATFRNAAIAGANAILQKHNIPAGAPAHQAVHAMFNNALQPQVVFNHFQNFQANPQFLPAQQAAAHPALQQHILNALIPRPAPSATQDHHDRYEQGLMKAAALLGVGFEAQQHSHRIPVLALNEILSDFANGSALTNLTRTFKQQIVGLRNNEGNIAELLGRHGFLAFNQAGTTAAEDQHIGHHTHRIR